MEKTLDMGGVSLCRIIIDVEKLNCIKELIIVIDLKLDNGINVLQVYAPQQGRTTVEKEEFYKQLLKTIDYVKYQENIILCGDWNGHIGCNRRGYEHNVGAHLVGGRNAEGQSALDFVKVTNLAAMNTYYQHRESHRWTWLDIAISFRVTHKNR